jgi:hypothetical protein
MHYLVLTPKRVDGTAVGGCSFMIHVRHAAAAIPSGLCGTGLITRGESGRSGVGAPTLWYHRSRRCAEAQPPVLPGSRPPPAAVAPGTKQQ